MREQVGVPCQLATVLRQEGDLGPVHVADDAPDFDSVVPEQNLVAGLKNGCRHKAVQSGNPMSWRVMPVTVSPRARTRAISFFSSCAGEPGWTLPFHSVFGSGRPNNSREAAMSMRPLASRGRGGALLSCAAETLAAGCGRLVSGLGGRKRAGGCSVSGFAPGERPSRPRRTRFALRAGLRPMAPTTRLSAPPALPEGYFCCQ